MGVVSKPETKRDKKLIRDYLAKKRNGDWLYTIPTIGFKHRRIVDGKDVPLTSTRIYQILDKYNVPKRRVRALTKDYTSEVTNSLNISNQPQLQ
mgnify:CR=1 FL=1